jgi:hypothetical protein
LSNKAAVSVGLLMTLPSVICVCTTNCGTFAQAEEAIVQPLAQFQNQRPSGRTLYYSNTYAMAGVYRILQRSSFLRPYLPNRTKKYDLVSADDEALAREPTAPRLACPSGARQCRICLSDDAAADDLISPCLCAGSVRWVHRACLDEWRAQEVREDSFVRCELCHFTYVTETRERPLRARLRTHALVARDLCALFGAVQLVIVLQAVLLHMLDTRGRLVSKLGGGSGWAAWYTLSLVVVFACIGLVGMCVACASSDGLTAVYLCDPWLSASTGDCLFGVGEMGEAGAAATVVIGCVVAALVLVKRRKRRQTAAPERRSGTFSRTAECVPLHVTYVFSYPIVTYVFSYIVKRHVDLTQRRDQARHVAVVCLSKRPELGRSTAAGGREGAADSLV